MNFDLFFKLDNYCNFVPADEYIYSVIKNRFKTGDLYRLTIKKPRSLHSLGKYWLLLQAIEYFHGGTDQYWHEQFKIAYFGAIEVRNFLTNEIQKIPKQSIAFEKLDEIEFKKYLTFVFEKLNEQGVDGNQLIGEFKNQI